MPNLRDKNQFLRFGVVQAVGMVVDIAVAVGLVSFLAFNGVIAAATGFLTGGAINYCGHNLFSYTHTDRASITLRGYVHYMAAVSFSLLVRLVVVGLLDYLTAIPFWLVMIIGVGVSFMLTYVSATLWVFRDRSGDTGRGGQ